MNEIEITREDGIRCTISKEGRNEWSILVTGNGRYDAELFEGTKPAAVKFAKTMLEEF